MDQLNKQADFYFGRGSWYAKEYNIEKNSDGKIILSVDVVGREKEN